MDWRHSLNGTRQGESHHNVFDSLEIHSSKHVLFRANDDNSLTHHNRIQHCIIRDVAGPTKTGEGMYLGCNDNKCQFFENVVEGNHIFGTKVAEQGDGIELKRGSWGNLVQGNVVHETNYPGIFSYGSPGKAPNEILRNIVFDVNANAIQVSSDTIVRHNIVQSDAQAISVQFNQGDPENVDVSFNTVLDGTLAVRGTNGGSGNVKVTNNLLVDGNLNCVSCSESKVSLSGNIKIGSAAVFGGKQNLPTGDFRVMPSASNAVNVSAASESDAFCESASAIAGAISTLRSGAAQTWTVKMWLEKLCAAGNGCQTDESPATTAQTATEERSSTAQMTNRNMNATRATRGTLAASTTTFSSDSGLTTTIVMDTSVASVRGFSLFVLLAFFVN